MEQKRIGAFIANCRKEQKMTQVQLAEKLGVTNKAVSKWETGRCLPDASLFDDICLALGITLNELLAGEKIEPENIVKKAEENLTSMAIEFQSREHFIVWGIYGIVFFMIIIVMINSNVGGMWLEGIPVFSNLLLSVLFIAIWWSTLYFAKKNMFINKVLVIFDCIFLISSVIAFVLALADWNGHIVFCFGLPSELFLYGLRLIFSWFQIYAIAIALSVINLIYTSRIIK